MYQPEIPEPSTKTRMPAHCMRALNRLLCASGIAPLRPTRFLLARCATGERATGERDLPGKLPARIGRVVVFIEEHLEEPLSLDRMADEANLSKYHFSRLFRDEVGRTPWAYVREARVKKAKTLLERGFSPVTAAVEAGFFDQSHFTKVMKEVEGKTPGAYQKEHYPPCRKNLQE